MEIREIQPTIIVAPAFKRVAAYARVSVEKQASLDSLSNQVSYYNDYIGNHPGWIFAGVYADYGLTGTKMERPEFQRMLADSRAGKIDVIITKSITRFARNTVILLKTVRELKELGIEVIFEKEEISSMSPDIDLLLTLLAMYAEEESRSASENKRWQIKKYFEAGRPTYFRIYGYEWVNERLEQVPEEAEIVRRIFRMYLSGMGREAIARKLNEEGITIRGSHWVSPTIHRILRNEKYAGNMLLQKTYRPDYRTKKDIRNKGEVRQYYVEESHEPIIDLETFNAVQAEIACRNRQEVGSNTKPDKSLFRGVITCQLCGKKYRYKNQRIKSSNSYVPTWKCGTFLDLGKEFCAAKQIRESILIEKTREILGLGDDVELTREMIIGSIDSIESADNNKLRFVLKSGHIEVVRWENPSRSKSWTPEMREHARQKSLEQYRKRKEKEE